MSGCGLSCYDIGGCGQLEHAREDGVQESVQSCLQLLQLS